MAPSDESDRSTRPMATDGGYGGDRADPRYPGGGGIESRFDTGEQGPGNRVQGPGPSPDGGSSVSPPGQVSLFLIGTALFVIGLGVVLGFQGVGSLSPDAPVINDTATATPTGTVTDTVSPTVSATPTATITPTPTETDDGGLFDDDTETESETPTEDDDGVFFGTESPTPTPTESKTSTDSETPTESETETWTATQSESSDTPQDTATETYTATVSDTSNSMAAAATGVWSLVAGLFEWLTLALLSTVAVVLEIR